MTLLTPWLYVIKMAPPIVTITLAAVPVVNNPATASTAAAVAAVVAAATAAAAIAMTLGAVTAAGTGRLIPLHRFHAVASCACESLS